ncbi:MULTISPECIES: transglycosylase domain-containing protein [Streptomycetaceae]|uniref:Putative penicillin-binding protein n=1 Tax=Streptantibioticus cattleyicolor (strain ATCC 35852 / DSM 46488 / JCM 4925 / NBRC 14057 / NRRL 8057) TaxID=1003195 RepID=F8JTD8_STREN|nr:MULTISPECIES: transglycosylase domain-containing protein [Streptomycetaceae]AEW94291.1 putative penicillin-binding protein [Streptantibioticus cattleyicolor NRRL 8057 = DSM 46488]MYS58947.1 penicillin-binding protein [Streptomyces sp. SID5468]CCB74648.1 Penicillin-binding protein [Streptantibioticus cattleyicolor NRRL 8057 = DSM 46488]
MSDEPSRPDDGDARAHGAGHRHRRRRRRTGWRRLVPTWRMTLGGVLLLLLLVCGGFVAGYLLVDIPPANAAATAQNNVYLYADGTTEIARSGAVNRQNVPLSQVPRSVQHAVLAAEDRDFYSESAVDPRAMVRAAWYTLNGRGRQSGSTITQQYVKNYYLTQSQTVKRKVEEFFIAIKLDREESKDQILEGYLNTSFYGRNAYGIQAAAHAYYNKDVSKLTTAEGAYLASLLNAPSAYDVVAEPQNRDRAVARWNYVLDGMVKKGWLSAAERQRMRFPMPVKSVLGNGLSGQRGYLVEAVRNYLIENKVVDEQTLAAGGYRIVTTIDKAKEDAFVKAAQDQLLSKLSGSGSDRYVRAGGASVDPATGDVVALYGGLDYTKQYVSNATRHDYQVGSTFKPFVLASALEHSASTQDGQPITPDTRYDGTNHREVQGPDGPVGYAPANEDDRSYGDITVTEATNRSVNAVYAQMAQDVGAQNVKRTAIDLGVPENTPDMPSRPAIALGTATASAVEMASAYATLDDHGRYLPYSLVAKVSRGGENVTLPHRDGRQAVSRRAADTTTAVLRDVVDSADGTGNAAQAAGRPAAGKTGTAEFDQAVWFAGYTPDLVTVVTVMGEDSDTGKHESLYDVTGLDRVNGGGYPAQIWAQYTADALQGRPVADFDLQAAGDTGLPPSAPPSSSSSAPASPPASAPPATPPGTTAPPPTPPATSGPPTMNPAGGGQGGVTVGTSGGPAGGATEGGAGGPGGGTSTGASRGGEGGTTVGPSGGGQGGASAGTAGTGPGGAEGGAQGGPGAAGDAGAADGAQGPPPP